jgi:hypothetical protein
MTTYAETIKAVASLVSYWRLNETSGTQAKDSKSTNHGTYTGTFTLAQASPLTDGDATAKSVSFDGSSGYVSVPANAALRPASVTVEAWAYAEAVAAENGIVTSNTYTSNVGFALCSAYGNAKKYEFGSFNGGWGRAESSSEPGLKEWQHLVGTYDSTTTKKLLLYRNGVLVGEASIASLTYDAAELRIARNWVSLYWNGRIAEVSLYNAALSAAVVKEHYEAGLAPEVTKPANQTWYENEPVKLQISAVRTTEYKATGLPAGVTINASNGLISGTPTEKVASAKTVTITCKGSTGLEASTTFTFTVGLYKPLGISATPSSAPAIAELTGTPSNEELRNTINALIKMAKGIGAAE